MNRKITDHISATFSKKTIAIAAIVCIVIVFIAGILISNTFRTLFSGEPIIEEVQTVSATLLEERIRELSELITLIYNYRDVVFIDEYTQLAGLRLPGTRATITMVYDGAMRMGVDLALASVRIDGSVITIGLPAAQIVAHEIGNEEIKDERTGLFNRIDVPEYLEYVQERRQEMRERVVELGLLDQAQENARIQVGTFIVSLLDMVGTEERFEVRFIEV